MVKEEFEDRMNKEEEEEDRERSLAKEVSDGRKRESRGELEQTNKQNFNNPERSFQVSRGQATHFPAVVTCEILAPGSGLSNSKFGGGRGATAILSLRTLGEEWGGSTLMRL